MKLSPQDAMDLMLAYGHARATDQTSEAGRIYAAACKAIISGDTAGAMAVLADWRPKFDEIAGRTMAQCGAK